MNSGNEKHVNTADEVFFKRLFTVMEKAVAGLNGMSYGEFGITFVVHGGEIRNLELTKVEKNKWDAIRRANPPLKVAETISWESQVEDENATT